MRTKLDGFAERYTRGLAVVATFILLGALRSVLAGVDYASTEQPLERTLLLNLVLLPIYTFAIVGLLLRSREAWDALKASWPLYVLPALALVSVVWSVDRAVSLDKALILALVYATGLAIVVLHGPANTNRIFATAGGAIIVGSILMAIGIPRLGVHQTTDIWQAVHSGSWRGVFSHRTAMGQFSAIYFVFLMSRSYAFKRQWMRFGLAAGAVLCILMSRSTGAMLTIVLGCSTLMFARYFVRGGVVIQTIATTLCIAVAIGINAAKTVLLENVEVIGKDATLTGRTDIWAKIMMGMYDHEVLGLGYISGFKYVFRMFFPPDYPLPNSQNGFLDIYVAFGIIGLALILASWVALYLMALSAANAVERNRLKRSDHVFNQLALVITLVIVTAQMSIGESFYVESNNFLTATLALLVPSALVSAMKFGKVELSSEFRGYARQRRSRMAQSPTPH